MVTLGKKNGIMECIKEFKNNNFDLRPALQARCLVCKHSRLSIFYCSFVHAKGAKS